LKHSGWLPFALRWEDNDPVVDFLLEVHLRDGGSYEAHSKGLVPRLDVPRVQPGTIVPVKVDPKNPARVALDMWDCPRRGGKEQK